MDRTSPRSMQHNLWLDLYFYYPWFHLLLTTHLLCINGTQNLAMKTALYSAVVADGHMMSAFKGPDKLICWWHCENHLTNLSTQMSWHSITVFIYHQCGRKQEPAVGRGVLYLYAEWGQDHHALYTQVLWGLLQSVVSNQTSTSF